MMVMKRRGKEDQAEVMREMKKKKATHMLLPIAPVKPYQ
jgi:hypothetical protein